MIAALILLLPLVAMQFTDEVIWDETDFAVIGVMLFGACGAYELAARMTGNIPYRAAVGVAVVAAFILIWINLAVGIIGSEDNPANLMYGGVLAVGILGALIVRFQPHGMARALAATALVQALVGVIAMIAGLGSTGANWPEAIVVLTGFFAALWLISALAVSESGAGANFRGRSAVSSACNIRKDGDAASGAASRYRGRGSGFANRPDRPKAGGGRIEAAKEAMSWTSSSFKLNSRAICWFDRFSPMK